MLEINPEDITAEVYWKHKTKVFYYAKIFIPPPFSLYISSVSVQKSPKYPERGLYVQPPSVPNNGRFIKPLEFVESELWKVIKEKAIDAVKQYEAEDWVPSDDDLKNFDKGLSDDIDKIFPDKPP